MKKFLLLPFVLAIGATAALAQWGPPGGCSDGQCLAPELAVRRPVIFEYHWVAIPSEPNQTALYFGKAQRGVWRHDWGCYQALTPTGDWYPANLPAGVSPPPPPPAPAGGVKKAARPCSQSCGCGSCGDDCHCGEGRPCSDTCRCVVTADKLPTGVVWDKLTKHGPTYRHGGQEVSKHQILAALGADKNLVDDSQKFRLTIISTDKAARDRVLTDLQTHPALAPWRDTCRIQAYDPADKDYGWAVARYGFVTQGSPVICFQSPDGKELWRQSDYSGGPEALAQALRKADPNYKPDLTPNPHTPAPAPAPAPVLPASLPTGWVVAGLTGLALFLVLRTKKN